MESLRLKKSPFVPSCSFHRGERRKSDKKGGEKFSPPFFLFLMEKAKRGIKSDRDWNNCSVMKRVEIWKNDLWKNLWSPGSARSPRHQLNQEGLLFNYLGWRVGLVSPPCTSVPDILSAAINEKKKKKKNPASVGMGTCRKSGASSYEGSDRGIENQLIKITWFRLEASLFENRLIT